MAKDKEFQDEYVKWLISTLNYYNEDGRDFSILKEFTDEELSQELIRRTSLGKELE